VAIMPAVFHPGNANLPFPGVFTKIDIFINNKQQKIIPQ